MNKVQFYTVAGHTFRVEMSENENVWQGIHFAYAPFVELSNCPPLFALTVSDVVIPDDTRLILKDPSSKAEEAKLDVYRSAYGYLFEMRTPFTDKVNCQLRLSPDFSTAEATLFGNDTVRLYGLNSALMLCYLLATAPLDTVLMHASAVVNNGKAYLFLGRSGTGKSTHSRLWLQCIPETMLLNDDHPIIRIDKDGSVIAYGSPWSGKTACYHNKSAPIGGIVRIKRALANSIKRLSPVESYASLLTSSSGMTWQKELADSKDRTLQKIISSVPCHTLECLPDEAAARLCVTAMRKEERCGV